MINCQEAKEYISLKLDDMLNDNEQKVLDEHLHSCKSCQAYDERMSQLDLDMKKLPKIELGQSVVDTLFDQQNPNQLDQHLKNNQNKRKSFFRRIKPWHGVIAAAIIVGIILPSFQDKDLEQIYSLDQPNNEKQAALAEAPRFGVLESNQSDDGSNYAGNQGIVAPEATDNAEVAMDSALKEDEDFPYSVEENNNRLIIYDDKNQEVYQSTSWNEAYHVEWEIIDKNIIRYTLYDKDNRVAARYVIEIDKKSEKKLAD